MKKIFFIVCMITVSMSFAKKWDATYISKLIAGGGIDKVIEYYKGKYYGETRDPQDAFRIAELYVKKKEYATAMEWYDKESQLINTSKVNLFNYANTNRLMGEYQKALDGYLMYAALTGDVNKVMDLANQCEKILKSSALSYNYKLENYTYNTSSDESNIAVLRTNPVYVTIKNANAKDEKPTYEIYQVVREFQNFLEPVKAYNNNIPKLIITSLSYTQDGNTVVFSARDEKASSKKGKAKTERIYTADNLGGSFLNVKPFPFNVDGYSLRNPSFNTDGTAVYFSSNQPGGVGGFDIWESDLVNDKWTTPKNLGKLLNSTADDIAPFVCQDGINNTLYFSSDREGGFGGFDIYSAKKINDIWQGVEMQTAPINSAADDVSIIYDDEIKTGYVASNRSGGKGGLDVYRFTPFNLKLIVNANDTFSEKIIDYALVQVYDGNEKLFEGVTDETGRAVFQINKDKNYTLKISKDNYRPVTQKINSVGKSSGDSVVVSAPLKADAQFSIAKGATNNLSLDNYIIFTGIVTDAATGKASHTAKMRMVNYTTQKLREVDIAENGRFEIKLLLNNNYKIIFENQENKITDELTTFGLEKNSVKVRDYQLSGNKFKLTDNKVFKADNVPPGMNLKFVSKSTTTTGAVTEKNEPITQTKIDSLMKVIAADNPQTPSVNKVAKQKVIVSAPEVKQEIPVAKIVETKTEEIPKTDIKVENTINASALKSDTLPTPTETKKEELSVEQQVNRTEQPDVATKPAEVKKEVPSITKDTDMPLLAADMVSTKKVKKVKNNRAEEPAVKNNNVTDEQVISSEPKEKPEPVTETIQENEKTTKEVIAEAAPKTTIQETPPVKEISENKVAEPTVTAVQTKPNPVATITPEKTTIPSNNVTKQEEEVLPDLYFKVQLDSYDQGNIKFPEFEYLGKVEEVKAYDRYIYRLGNFNTIERAKEVLELVRSKGYFVAFILQYNKDKVTGIVK